MALGGRSLGLTPAWLWGFRSFCVQHCPPPLSAHASCLQSVTFPSGGAPDGPDCGWYPLSLLKVWLEVNGRRPCGELAGRSMPFPPRWGGVGSWAWLTAISCLYTDISIYMDSSDFKPPFCDQHGCLGALPVDFHVE